MQPLKAKLLQGLVLLWATGGVAAPAPSPSGIPKYSLGDCINLALESNTEVLIAQKRIEEAAGGIIVARAGFLPALSSSTAYTKQDSVLSSRNNTNFDTRDENWFVSIRLTQNIFSSGAARGRMAIAKLAKNASLLNYQAIVDQVIYNVRVAFYDVLLNKSSIAVRQKAIDILKEQLRGEKNREEIGEGSKLQLLRADVALANEMPALIEAQNRWKNSYVNLSELLSIPYSVNDLGIPFEVEGSLEYHPQSFDFKDCLAKAEMLRPEMRAREKEIEIQQKQIAVTQSAVLPRINVFAGYDLAGEPSISAPYEETRGYIVGISGNWQLFDGLQTMGQMKVVRSQLAAAELTRDATRRAIQSEVRQAFYDLEKAEAVIASQTKNVSVAYESLELNAAAFEAGLITQLDVLQSRADLTRAQVAELSGRYTFLVALAKLQRAISSNFQILNDDATSPKPTGSGTAQTPQASPSAPFKGVSSDAMALRPETRSPAP